MSEYVTFKAKPEAVGPKGAWTFITLTDKVHKALGGDKARIPVVGFADEFPIQTSAQPMDGKHVFMFNKDMQKGTGNAPGESVTFRLKRDTAKRTVRTPSDLNAALKGQAEAKAFYGRFSYSQKKAYVDWITGAKKDDTRARRIAQAVDMLAQGKKRQ